MIATIARATFAADVSITGVIHYTGSLGPVSTSQPIQLFLGKSRNHPFASGQVTVTDNDSPIQFAARSGNNYYLMYFLDLMDDGRRR